MFIIDLLVDRIIPGIFVGLFILWLGISFWLGYRITGSIWDFMAGVIRRQRDYMSHQQGHHMRYNRPEEIPRNEEDTRE